MVLSCVKNNIEKSKTCNVEEQLKIESLGKFKFWKTWKIMFLTNCLELDVFHILCYPPRQARFPTTHFHCTFKKSEKVMKFHKNEKLMFVLRTVYWLEFKIHIFLMIFCKDFKKTSHICYWCIREPFHRL